MTARRRGRGEDRLAARLDALAEALALGGEELDADDAAEAAAVLRRAGQRMRLSGAHTVVALAGPTGAGKSSLFNVLCGAELSQAGVRRPTTARTSACVWGEDEAAELLDWLEVARVHRVRGGEALDGLVLLDLPDHDSTAVAHRREVDRLVELVDVLVWVTDPQKYADASLHERYLQPLAGHADVMVAVLNQTDRLSDAESEACQEDLRRLLLADGLERPRVLGLSARTGAGVDQLRELLAEAVRARAAARRRTAADVDRAVEPLLAAVAPTGPTAARRDRSPAALVAALEQAAGVPTVTRAVERSVRRRAALASGWPPTRWLRRLRPDPLRRLGLGPSEAGRGPGGADGVAAVAPRRASLPEVPPVALAQVERAVTRAADEAASGLPVSWVVRVRAAARGGPGDLADALDRAVGSVRADDVGASRGLWWEPLARTAQWLLLATVVVGLGWLAALAGLAYLRVPEPPTPDVRGLPWPTALLLGGLLGALAVAVLGRLAGRLAARRRARRARRLLRAAVADVARSRVLTPVEDEVARWARTHELLSAAARR